MYVAPRTYIRATCMYKYLRANICRRILEESQFFTRGAPIFQGETYSNRNSVSLLARFLLAGKIAGKEARQQNVAVAENNFISLKKARMLRCAVGETQETGWSWPAIFFQTQKWPFKNRDPPTGLGPTTVPSKIRCLMVPILPVWHKNWKIFPSYRLRKMRVTRQNRAKVSKVET